MKINAFKHRFHPIIVAVVGTLLSTWIACGSGVSYAAGSQRQPAEELHCGDNYAFAQGEGQQGEEAFGTVVVARQDDPYHSLAEKIAEGDRLTMVEDFADALAAHPRFVILVASPDRLTAELLASIGNAFVEHDSYPGFGIISGSTIEQAEQLWARRNSAQAGNSYLAGDVDILQRVFEPAIYDISDDSHEEIELNKENLIAALGRADYFYWARHTGSTDWSWNEESPDWSEDDQLRAKDIPQLLPVVLFSPTCSSFRPWAENALSLAFPDNGAAAFVGFVNTPHTTSFMRWGLAVPGITSWSEFPVGLVAQVQNRSATGAIFRTPQLFMMGDPRVYLYHDRPYEIIGDTVEAKGTRVISGESDFNGVLAVKIEGGADYHFTRVAGLTSVSENDTFYNNKLQTLDLGRDKYVLLLHDGGRFSLELQQQAPLWWQPVDTLTDAFDSSWVVLWLSTYADGNPHFDVVSLVILVALLLFGILKRKHALREYNKIFLVALMFALVRLAYFLLRMGDYSVNSSPVIYSPLQIALGAIGVFSSAAAGLILMRDCRRKRGKVVGLFLALLRESWMTGFYLAYVILLNTVTPLTRNTESWLLSFDPFWMSFIVYVFEVLVVLVAYRIFIARRTPRDPAPAES